MNKTTRDLTLPTTITGSLPRPTWYTENLGARRFRDAFADARFREQYTDAVGTYIRDQERAGLDIVTDGDARFDNDVGGMSWLQYPARRFKGSPAVITTSPKGLRRRCEGDIIFEVMESRVMPRCCDKIERGPLQYTDYGSGPGYDFRPVKFGHHHARTDRNLYRNDYYRSAE